MTRPGSGESAASGGRHWTRTCREATTGDRAVRLVVHTRSAAPAFGTRELYRRVRDRVGDLEEQGRVDDVTFEVWGTHLEANETDRSATSLDALRAWARRHDVTLPFEERRCNSMLIEDSYTVTVPPHVLVTLVDEDDEILGVAPSRSGTDSTSVMDLLTLLEEPERRRENRASASA